MKVTAAGGIALPQPGVEAGLSRERLVLHGVRHRHHSQAPECRTRDRTRASRRAAALPIRFCRAQGRREFLAARRRLPASWSRFRFLRSSVFFAAFDFGVRGRFQTGSTPRVRRLRAPGPRRARRPSTRGRYGRGRGLRRGRAGLPECSRRRRGGLRTQAAGGFACPPAVPDRGGHFAAAASSVRRVCSTASTSTPVSGSGRQPSFRPSRKGPGYDLAAASTATAYGRGRQPRRSARRAARTRTARAPAARRARSYGAAVRLRVSGRSTAWSLVPRGTEHASRRSSSGRARQGGCSRRRPPARSVRPDRAGEAGRAGRRRGGGVLRRAGGGARRRRASRRPRRRCPRPPGGHRPTDAPAPTPPRPPPGARSASR